MRKAGICAPLLPYSSPNSAGVGWVWPCFLCRRPPVLGYSGLLQSATGLSKPPGFQRPYSRTLLLGTPYQSVRENDRQSPQHHLLLLPTHIPPTPLHHPQIHPSSPNHPPCMRALYLEPLSIVGRAKSTHTHRLLSKTRSHLGPRPRSHRFIETPCWPMYSHSY